MNWQIYPLTFCMFLSCACFAQVYQHNLANAVDENHLTYYLNTADEVIPEGLPYHKVRRAVRKNTRQPFEITEHYKDGVLALHTMSESPDPISMRWSEYYISYFPNGDTSEVISFKKDKKDGLQRNYFDTGQLKSQKLYNNDQLTGPYFEYHANGNFSETGKYVNGYKSGEVRTFYEDGSLRSIVVMKDGKRNGPELVFHENGDLKSRTLFVDNQPDGPYEALHLDSVLATKGQFKSGYREGVWEYYLTNGDLKSSMTYDQGTFDGPFFESTDWGDTLAYGEMEEGKFSGFVRAYDLDQHLVYQRDYRSATPVSERQYGPREQVRRKGRMTDKGMVYLCLDREGEEQPCDLQMYASPTTERDLERFISLTLQEQEYDNYEPQGVYSFDVDPMGKVSEVRVIEPANEVFDRQLIKLIKTFDWNAGLYFGVFAVYSNEIKVRFKHGNNDVQFGNFYLNDSTLSERKYIPLYRSQVEAESRTPVFEGGEKGLFQYLGSETKFPAAAQAEGLNGTCFVQFQIEPSGMVSSPEVLAGVHPALDYEAVRVVKNMPLWIAGVKDGKEVSVYYKLPFRFTLK